MRRWFRKLIRNSFFQVGAGLFIVMIIGGVVIMYLEAGSITEKETPFWWAIVTMTTVGMVIFLLVLQRVDYLQFL